MGFLGTVGPYPPMSSTLWVPPHTDQSLLWYWAPWGHPGQAQRGWSQLQSILHPFLAHKSICKVLGWGEPKAPTSTRKRPIGPMTLMSWDWLCECHSQVRLKTLYIYGGGLSCFQGEACVCGINELSQPLNRSCLV